MSKDTEYFVAKSFYLAIAHRLQHHRGKCKNIHGHNYKVEICFQRKAEHTSNEDGMVIDFGDVKERIVSHFMESFDHCLFLEYDDPLVDVFDHLDFNQNRPMKRHIMTTAPTAENMAHMFLVMANNVLEKHGHNNVTATLVTVWETDTSRAAAAL